jgi:hypothetical protein
MKMTLSSNRAILARYLFQELEQQSLSQPNKKQIIFVPEGCMAGWLALTKALHGVKGEGGEVFVLQDMKIIQDDPSFSFHFFGFRELSVSLLPTISKDRLHWYFFSPCAHFWSDLLSEREIGKRVARVKVHSRNEVQAALDNFYLEANSLLSNAATLGREAASLLDEIPCEVEALYPVPYDILEEEIYKERLFDNELFSPTLEKKTLLHYIQADLIFLIGAREEKKALPYEDSFTLVEAPTVRSEVSLLQEALHELSKIRPLDIGDVLILSPNPAKYEGALFDLMKEKNLKVQTVYEENPPLILKMKRWMAFLLGRFHQEDLLTLLSMPEMEPLLECDGEELQELREKILSLSMSWGMSYEFKKNYISYHGIEAQEEKLHVGTVEDVYGTILHSLFEKNSVDVDSQSLWDLSIRFFAFLKQISLLWPLPLFELSAAPLQEWVRRMKALLIFLQKGFSGDEVLIPTPFWVTYAAQVQLAGGNIKYLNCFIDTDFKLRPEQLEEAISPNTKLFIFSSPCNPTGSVYTREELAALVVIPDETTVLPDDSNMDA